MDALKLYSLRFIHVHFSSVNVDRTWRAVVHGDYYVTFTSNPSIPAPGTACYVMIAVDGGSTSTIVSFTMKANKSNIFRGVKNMDPLVILTLDAQAIHTW